MNNLHLDCYHQEYALEGATQGFMPTRSTSHQINSREVNFPPDQLPTRSTPARSTSHQINSHEVNSHQINVTVFESMWVQEVYHFIEIIDVLRKEQATTEMKLNQFEAGALCSHPEKGEMCREMQD